MTKLVIYDCDGVLFKSEKAVLAYYDFVCDEFNLPKLDKNNPDEVKNAMMKTNTEIIDMLTDDIAKKKEILEFANNMNFRHFLHLMEPEMNLEITLKKLKEMKISMAIFTNRGKSLHYLLKHYNLNGFFDYKVTSFDVENAKPHPEGLYKILNYFGTIPEETLYIGDSSTDYFAAKEAKIPFVAYANKLYEAPVINNHLDILNFIKK